MSGLVVRRGGQEILVPKAVEAKGGQAVAAYVKAQLRDEKETKKLTGGDDG